MVLNFNTSHVTVYLHRIHTKKCLLCNFNTSHVTVYHYSVEICQAGRKISIHPMLRFIRYIPSNCSSSCEFQYIPCYGLSMSGVSRTTIVLLFQYIPCYGLSGYYFMHRQDVNRFQYIPCYGLSLTISRHKSKGGKFQYIPCYGLSNDFKPFLSWHLSSFPLFYVISAFFTSRL